ncbi:MAG: HD domain-containing protein [Clostridiales bacterium]|nr:HD domain-containing protein [Clostridiales bacterium]
MPVYGSDLERAHAIAGEVARRGGRAYFVGGFVRDHLMGVKSKDVDIEVYGLMPDELGALLDGFGEVYEKGAAFRVFGLRHTDIDIAMPRSESRIGEGHRDFAVTVDPFLPKEIAASRRDFTINAMMMDILTGEIIDLFGGKEDLENRIIRHVNDATFADDALRVYRAAQFAARLNAQVAPETVELCRSMETGALSRERVFAEMEKALLQAETPSVYFSCLKAFGKLPEILIRMENTPQNPEYHPEGDVLVHTMQVLDRAAKLRSRAQRPRDFMLAALCHDMGKTVSTKLKNGKITSAEHADTGAPLAKAFLQELTSDRALLAYVENMVLLHMRPNLYVQDKSRPAAFRRMYDEALCPEDLILLSVADKGDEKCEAPLRAALDDYYAIMEKPMVLGRDLIAAGIPAGPHMAELVARARRLHFSGHDKRSALRLVVREYEDSVRQTGK